MNVFVGITFGFLDMKASFSTDFEKITALGELKNTCICNTNGDGDGNDDNDERTMVMMISTCFSNVIAMTVARTRRAPRRSVNSGT